MDNRSVLIGAASLIAGYFVCTSVLIAFNLSWLWLVLAASASVASGFVGALFAPAKPLINGTLGPALGASIPLFITIFGAHAFGQSAGLEQATPFLAAVALAFCGALIAVHVWPRHGL